jgi:TrmH family RNA methyltransferase
MSRPTNQSDLDRLVVVLVDTRNPLNLGAAARAMSNFGFLQLRVVRPYEPSFREARSAVGASEVLARALEFGSVPEAVADCTFVAGTTAARDRELRVPLHTPAELAPSLHHAMQSGRVAILFGSEKRGLSNADLNLCHALIRIPARDEHSSVNLGQAVAVCLYEMVRAAAPVVSTTDSNLATHAELERILRALIDSLQASGYIQAGAERTTEEKVRGLLRRLNLRSSDAEIVMGMLRQILWKLRGLGDGTEK